MNNKTIGEKISPILIEIEGTLDDHKKNRGTKPNFTERGFRAAVSIFMEAMLDKTFELQENEKMELKDRKAMATKLGAELKKLIKTYTNIDTVELFKQKNIGD